MLVCQKYLFCVLLIAAGHSLQAQTFPGSFSASNVGSGWVSPVGAAFNNAGTKLFVWEKGGKVFLCKWNASTLVYDKQATPVLDISPEVGNWRDFGLTGFALDPDFDNNGLIYLLYVVDRHYLMNFGTGSYNAATNQYYAATIGRITRYKTITSGSNIVADLATRTILLGETASSGPAILYESHGVGTLAFAADGTLLASAGDGANYNGSDNGNNSATYYVQALSDGIIRANENVGAFRSQMINSYCGKILRIDPVTGNGVSSNPYYNAATPRSAASRVWALGLRNPFRFCVRPNTGSTNPATGDIGEIYLGDVGMNTYEELNIIKEPASNLGWPIFEGITASSLYVPLGNTTYNKDEPNPLYGIGGCTQQYFSFNNLIKQATGDNNHTIYNPCNGSVAITSPDNNRFFHRVPALDWKHGTDSARVKKFTGNTLGISMVGTAGSGVTGSTFRGNCAVGGTWYNGNMFPVQYKNTYFHADYGATWIKNFNVQFVDQVQSLSDFSSGWSAIVCLVENPLDGSMVCVDLGANLVKKVVYGGNQSPVVKMSSNITYGPAPMTINFTGNTSYDPEGAGITYSWNFGDGSAVNTTPNPSHTFTTGNGNPKKFVVKLTVKDNLNATSVDSIIVSANNTPPDVHIISPVNNSFYDLGSDTTYTLQATAIDLEHHSNELSYVWQTALKHNNHQHPEPLDTNKVTSDVISRIGCNGDDYYWFIKLTVTDAAGLYGIDSSYLRPQCGGPLPLTLNEFKVAVRGQANFLSWITSEEFNLKNFQVQRSYDGVNFETIGTVKALMNAGLNNYDFKDESFLDGYIYYRLKMMDVDGKFAYSFVVRVFTGTKTNSGLTVSPNPFKNEFLFAAKFKEAGKISLNFIDTKGAIVRSVSKKVTAGLNSFGIDKLEGLPAAVYILEVKQGDETRKTKVIKVN
ncbi:MAG: PQQ-dependent sugar dehydrogenase [Ferruginibacter sp.]